LSLKKIIIGLVKNALKTIQHGKMAKKENIVTIISYEEFNELILKTGNDELTTMELIDAIAQINAMIYESKDYHEST
jgi:hypothetical protein|tara:strand:+ start:634 stop:864 length:231 start_codon:yes stop_codon:yes gene_type:complete